MLFSTCVVVHQACPPSWTQLDRRCFIFFREPKSWVDAETACIRIGGNLASIHSSEENLFLSKLIARVNRYEGLHTWIGGSDAVKERKWLWSDGTAFNYQRWGPGEPNNHGDNCIQMNYAGTFWRDDRCYSSQPYVCAKDAQILPH